MLSILRRLFLSGWLFSFTNDWDLTVPLTHTKFKNQPGHVRTAKTDVSERLDSFMYGFTSGETKEGNKHLILHNETTPTHGADRLILYAKDDADPTPQSELFAEHEANVITQLTNRGAISPGEVVTNNDGATLDAFDVVITDTANDESIKGTTSASDTTVRGVLQTQTADGVVGCLTKMGRTRVNTTGAVTRGNYLVTSTSKGLAADGGASRATGVFAQALTADAGGSNGYVIADVFPVLSVGVSAPVGSIVAWAKSITGVPSIPSGWVECDGSVLSDSDSLLNGETIPDLNGNNNYLRGASSSGGTGGTNSTHLHSVSGTTSTETAIPGAGGGGNMFTGTHSHTYSGNSGGTSHQPAYYEVVWIMRVK